VAVSIYKFGDFRLDCDRFELYRAGRSLKLERKPMELLVLLATRNGNLVTRTEIAEHLWGREVFVDTEHGINTAIRKIREVLNDDPVQSRFVQTVTGKGYRFIGSIIEVPAEAVASQHSDQSSVARNRRVGDINPSPTSAVAIQDLPQGNEEPPEAPLPSYKGEPSRPRKSRLLIWLLLSGGLTLLVLAVTLGARILRNRLHPTAPKITSLAVLPLDNLSGDPAQNYFADGMTDELTTMLAKDSTLRVVSRTSAMQYKGAHRPLPEIARELGVDGILEGSISRSGDKVHMTIQLIQAPTDTHLWAESYDRNANDIVTLPGEAAQTIAKQLGTTVPQRAPARYISPEAHDAFLRGRYIWFTGDNEEAGKYFKKATELQPDYALGWAGLAMYYGQGVLDGEIDPKYSAAGLEAARKAVALDDSLPEAHLVLGAMLLIDPWDFTQADRELGRAIELDPRFAEAYHFRSKMYILLNRNEEAIQLQKKAMELDPFERPYGMVHAYAESRQYDAAITDNLQRLATMPQDPILHWFLCDTYRRKGDLKQAAEEWEKATLLSGDKDTAAIIHQTYQKGGYSALLLWRINQLKQQALKKYVSPVDFALQYAQLGQKEKTLSYLEAGLREHHPALLWIQDDPAYDFLHSDERYRAIIKATGLPPKY
jgi:TolB-like protein/DNA-binding winged helix-turn-helix (wHTH) protein/Tfp pilus assembly protein PilF